MQKKRYSIIGDSVSTFRGLIPLENRWFYDSDDTYKTGIHSPGQTWWMRVIEARGGEFLANASFSGSMVEGWGFPAGCSIERARQVLGENGEAPDAILAYMGINDYGWGSPEAQAAGHSFSTPAGFDASMRSLRECADLDAPTAPMGALSQVDPRLYEGADPADVAPSEEPDRFERAYLQMLTNLRSVAPDAEIICVTLSPARVEGEDSIYCYALRGIELDSYNDAIRRACTAAGASVADVRALGIDYASIDGTHPTPKGMEQLATMVLASLGDADAKASLPTDMASVRESQEGLQAGCPKSPATSSGWKCIVPR